MFSIKIASLESGISAATLRKWEERYGFPKPVRNIDGSRSYSQVDIAKLKRIKSLIDQGFKPSKILTSEPTTDLIEHATSNQSNWTDESLLIYSLAKEKELEKTFSLLNSLKHSLSTRDFIVNICAPLAYHMGEGWSSGDIPTYIEHALSEQLHAVLAINENRYFTPDAPTAILCTLSSENHTLGLKMANALMMDNGCRTVYLGANLPTSEIADAARDLETDFIGISLSRSTAPKIITQHIDILANMVPSKSRIILGGSGSAFLKKIPDNCTIISDLAELPQLLKSMHLDIDHEKKKAL